MSLLDDNIDIDRRTLEVLILKYVGLNTYLNMDLNWNVCIEEDDVHDCISTPHKWYLYYTCGHQDYNIYIYSDAYVRPQRTYVVINKAYQPINLSHILYEPA